MFGTTCILALTFEAGPPESLIQSSVPGARSAKGRCIRSWYALRANICKHKQLGLMHAATQISSSGHGPTYHGPLSDQPDLETLDRIRKRVLWLSTYMVHYANSIRENSDDNKVGGHQASSASVVSLLTAYYFAAARPGDLISVKPHASPVYHSIQYLLGNLPAEKLRQLRSFGGLQAYPSRTKDPDGVHFSTGSVGLGAAFPNFAALAKRYVDDHFGKSGNNRFLALMGDAELDEGNVWEALSEDNLQQLGGIVWIVDLNRQSLDRVVPNGRVKKIEEVLRSLGCHVIEIKYGTRLEEIFERPYGYLLRNRIDQMPNDEYQSLLRVRDPAILRQRLGGPDGRLDPGLEKLIADYEPAELRSLLGDLGGHDLAKILAAFREADRVTDRPVVIIAYTVKGWGLPIAGDPLNHSRLLTEKEVADLALELAIPAGEEFARFEPDSVEGRIAESIRLRLFGDGAPRPAYKRVASSTIPDSLGSSYTGKLSTQQAFGNILSELSRRPEIRSRLVTTSPDVAITTNLGGWIQKVGVYCAEERIDFFHQNAVSLLLNWRQSVNGQHIELGISENNLFLMLGALGLTGDLFGEPLAPIGTIYDTFVARGLDALNYAVYNGARFVVAGTPSGISLSGEGGAHQSINPPSIGIEMPQLTYYEPCFAQELEWILLEAIRRVLSDPDSGSSYLRLSTVPLDQEVFPRDSSTDLRRRALAGGYQILNHRERQGYTPGKNVVNLFVSGVLVPLALEASRELAEEELYLNVINVTSADMLHQGWVRALRTRMRGLESPFYLEELVPPGERRCPIVTAIDGHPHALSFLGGVFGARTIPLGVDRFGQSGARTELYKHYEIDQAAMVRAAIEAVSSFDDSMA